MEDLGVAAGCIHALFRGDDTDEAEAGALLVAQALHTLVAVPRRR
jgi:hypothetical protein